MKLFGMRRLNLLADEGNASLEFVLVIGLFVSPLLVANQELTAMNLRQVALDAMSETIAREVALGSGSAETSELVSTLAEDSALDSETLNVSIRCEPQTVCTSDSHAVEVALRYKNAYSISRQLLQDSGSMLPLTLGLLAITFALIVAGANIEAANVFDQRASKIARFLVQEHFTDEGIAKFTDTSAEASRLAAQFSMNNFEISQAILDRTDGRTLTSTVCAKFELPIQFFGLEPSSRACGVSKMRLIG